MFKRCCGLNLYLSLWLPIWVFIGHWEFVFLSVGDASALNHWATKDANNQFEFNKKWKRWLSWDDNNQFGPNNRSPGSRKRDIRWACKRNENLICFDSIWFSKAFNMRITNLCPITDHSRCGSWKLGVLLDRWQKIENLIWFFSSLTFHRICWWIDLPNFKRWSKELSGQSLKLKGLNWWRVKFQQLWNVHIWWMIAPLPDDIDHNLAKLPPLYAFARSGRKGTQAERLLCFGPLSLSCAGIKGFVRGALGPI